MRKKTTIMPKMMAISMGVILATASFAQSSTSSTTPRLMIPDYNQSQLVQAGCDPNIWNKLVNDYLAKRGLERQIQGQIQVMDQVVAAPPAKSGGGSGGSSGGGASCVEGAINSINGAMQQVNALMAIFSGGGVDWGSLAGAIGNQITSYACNQINAYTGSMAYGMTQPITSTLGGVNSSINQAGVQTQAGNVNVGGYINRGNTSTIPYINSSQVGGQMGSTGYSPSTSWLQRINPFNNGTQGSNTTPDPLR